MKHKWHAIQRGLFFCPMWSNAPPSACVSVTCLKFTRVICVSQSSHSCDLWSLHTEANMMSSLFLRWASLAAVQRSRFSWRQPTGWTCGKGSQQRGRRANSCFTSARRVRLIEQDGGNRSSDFESGHDVSGNIDFCSKWAFRRGFLLPPAEAWSRSRLILHSY